MKRGNSLLVYACGLALASCASEAPPEELPGGRVAITVAPLSLPGVTNATWTLTVENESGAVVWSRQIDADAYGDGAGSVAYVGPCDADDDPNGDAAATNRVELVLDGLSAGGVALTAGVDFINPAPPGQAIWRSAVCEADADAAVSFDVTVARRAQQGFFDVAISFDDIFCSAKLDCRRDSNADGQITLADEPLRLLFDGTGARRATAVLGLACTGGAGEVGGTVLYREPVVVTCGGGNVATVMPDAGLGVVGWTRTGTDPLFGAAIYAGDEQLGFQKRYWNVALGVAGLASCTVTAAATATSGGWEDDTTPAGAPWPVIRWSVALTDASGALSCTSHPLDGGSGVTTGYELAVPFAARLPFALGSAGNPASSCRDILLDDAGSADGVYFVDPLGSGPVPVWCDMVGGGWTLVYRAAKPAGYSDFVGGRVSTADAFGAVPILPTSSGDHKLSDAFINAMRSGAVANDLRMTMYRGTPLAPVASSWHRSDCALEANVNHAVGHVCLDSTLGGPTATAYSASGHTGGLTRWYVDNVIGYIWGVIGTHVGPMPGGTGAGTNFPNPYCTWYDARTCPQETALELWIY